MLVIILPSGSAKRDPEKTYNSIKEHSSYVHLFDPSKERIETILNVYKYKWLFFLYDNEWLDRNLLPALSALKIQTYLDAFSFYKKVFVKDDFKYYITTRMFRANTPFDLTTMNVIGQTKVERILDGFILEADRV